MLGWRPTSTRDGWLGAASLLLLALLSTVTEPAAQVRRAPYTPEQLEYLITPVALYPDVLLAQVLQACREPAALVAAAAAQRDPAVGVELGQWPGPVEALLHVPDVLDRLAEEPQWAAELGEANRRNAAGVLAALGRVRQSARAVGNLESNEFVSVADRNGRLRIELADPGMLMVPVYDPKELLVQHDVETEDWLEWDDPTIIGGYRKIAVGFRSNRINPAASLLAEGLGPDGQPLDPDVHWDAAWGLAWAVGHGGRHLRNRGNWRQPLQPRFHQPRSGLQLLGGSGVFGRRR